MNDAFYGESSDEQASGHAEKIVRCKAAKALPIPDEITSISNGQIPFLLCSFLVKYNRVTQGLVNVGQCARDVDLFTIDGQPTTLFSQISTNQPSLILAGSTS